MTDATPLASEQITQEDRDEAHAIAVSWDAGRYDEAGSIVARHRIAALSATPAPSVQSGEERHDVKCDCVGASGPNPDCGRCSGSGCYTLRIPAAPSVQDASQAQGEVPTAWRYEYRGEKDAPWRVHFSSSEIKVVHANADYVRNPEPLYARPAPGATAQDGVERHDVRCDCVGASGPNPDCGRCSGSGCYTLHIPQAPTPTIPAGMVGLTQRLRGHANDLRKEEWDEDNAAAADCDQVADLLAAAPKQADPQGVEAIARALCKTFGENPEATVTAGDQIGNPIDVDLWELWQPDARKFLAALNAPTGAVEKGRGA